MIEGVDLGTVAIILSAALGLLSMFLAVRYQQFKAVLRALSEFLTEVSLTLEDDKATPEEIARCAAKAKKLRQSVRALVPR